MTKFVEKWAREYRAGDYAEKCILLELWAPIPTTGSGVILTVETR